jgi:hypothetical protein
MLGPEQRQTLTSDLHAAHASMSGTDLRFREFALQEPRLLERAAFKVLEDNKHRFSYRLQMWPTFLGQRKLDRLRHVSLAISRLVKSLPRRIFKNDPLEICRFYHLVSEAAAEMLISQPNGIEESFARGDLIETTDGFKCIEFNFTPRLGGWETSSLAKLHLAVPEVAEFISREGVKVTYSATTRLMLLHAVQHVRSQGISQDNEINIAMVLNPLDMEQEPSQEAIRALQEEYSQICRSLGNGTYGQIVPTPYRDLVPVRWELFCRGIRIHAVVELTDEITHSPAFRTFKVGNVALFNGPIEAILSTKENIALLSENVATDLFSPDEKEIIHRHIPWTRRVFTGAVEYQGEQVFLPEFMAANRERLVLKEATNFGGKGVTLGRNVNEAQWLEVVRASLTSGRWVVQECLESIPYLYQNGEYGCSPHDMIWGPFVFGDLYAGVILRMQPKADGGAVNLSLSATEGVVLEVEE